MNNNIAMDEEKKALTSKDKQMEEKFSRDELKDIYLEYAKISKNYASAIKEVRTKLEVLDDDFQLQSQHSPIHHMESRVKSLESIKEKLIRKGLAADVNSITSQLYDIAGIRVICHYIEDIYLIADLLKAQDDISVLKETDYIQNPKPNGYRSYHIVVTVPVFLVSGPVEIPVEVQIRTIAMDFWASLEHQLKYKSKGDIPQFIAAELKECAGTIASTDLRMQKIHSFLADLENLEKTEKQDDENKEQDNEINKDCFRKKG